GGRRWGEGGDWLLLGEPEPPRAVERLLDEALEAARRPPLARRRALDDEGAAALAAFQIAVLGELRQGPRHRVAVDPQETGELPHGGQLHARLEAAGADQVPDLGPELHVHRHTALPVDPEPRGRSDPGGVARHVRRRLVAARRFASEWSGPASGPPGSGPSPPRHAPGDAPAGDSGGGPTGPPGPGPRPAAL